MFSYTGGRRMIDGYTSIPSTSSQWNVGDMIWNNNPSIGSYIAWICKTSGTAGALTGVTASTAGNSTTATLSTVAGINVGDSLNFGGYIRTVVAVNTSNNTLTLNTAITPALSNITVQYNNPTWQQMGAMTATVSDMQLTSTTATTVTSLTPTVQGNFSIQLFYRVVTAATNVTITVSFTDGGGNAQAITLVNATGQAVGVYYVSAFINAKTTSTITISATVGTANQVYVSALIKPE